MGLEAVREAARMNKGMQFTALLHHVTPQLLAQGFYALRRDAADGIAGEYLSSFRAGSMGKTVAPVRVLQGPWKLRLDRRI